MTPVNISDYYTFELNVSYIDLVVKKICPLNFEITRKDRSMYGLIYLEEGTMRCLYENKEFIVQKDQILFFQKGVTYTLQAIGEAPVEFIVISFDVYQHEAMNHLPFDMVNSASRSFRLKELFISIEELFFSKGIAYQCICCSLTQNLIYELLKDTLFQKINSNQSLLSIKTAVDYIGDYYDTPIEISKLSKLSGYSISHFRRMFREIYGMSPIEYINHLRIEKSKEMLRSNLYSTQDIAQQCGFSNVYYFSKVFKKATGCTPKKY